jgi:hypothetical protein
VNRGTHAAGDGSFGRSAGNAGLRGIVLLVLAVAIGAVLLNRATSGPSTLNTVSAGPTTTAKPKPKKGHTTTTTLPPATTTTTSALRAPQTIKVLVANATTVKGQAGRYTNVVHTLGYNALAAVDATIRGLPHSVLYYGPGLNGEAALLGSKLGIPASSVLPLPATPPVVNLGGANLLVVVGLDLANAATTPGAGSTATTAATVRQAPATTAPRSTTTAPG